MNILFTGNRGRIGPAIERRLIAAGHTVSGFDIVDGNDIMDAEAVARAASGVDIIVHAAGIAGDRPVTPAVMMAIHLVGTSNVLCAADTCRVGRVIYMSSGRSLGMLERDPDYLPIDDQHRGLPSQPYALAKWLAEEMCEAFTNRTAIDTICLRPVQVFSDQDYQAAFQAPAPPVSRHRHWHLGVHLHLDDLADAVAAAVGCRMRGHSRLLLCAADIADHEPSRDLCTLRLPHVPWRGGDEFRRDPHRALVSITRAQEVLGWSPRRTWPARKHSGGATSSIHAIVPAAKNGLRN